MIPELVSMSDLIATIVDLINRLGYPVVVSGALAWYIYSVTVPMKDVLERIEEKLDAQASREVELATMLQQLTIYLRRQNGGST